MSEKETELEEHFTLDIAKKMIDKIVKRYRKHGRTKNCYTIEELRSNFDDKREFYMVLERIEDYGLVNIVFLGIKKEIRVTVLGEMYIENKL